MRLRSMQSILIPAVCLALAGSSQADIKFYDSSTLNGTPGDVLVNIPQFCPPVDSTPGGLEGFASLEDHGLGTVTLNELVSSIDDLLDAGSEILSPLFGPGAFFFADVRATYSITGSQLSNTSGVGARGPSGTGPGDSVEWGVVSGWEARGSNFCISSPTSVCNQNGFVHGLTVAIALPSDTYNLGTWNFDAEGDLEPADFYILQTSFRRSGQPQPASAWLVPRREPSGAAAPGLRRVGAEPAGDRRTHSWARSSARPASSDRLGVTRIGRAQMEGARGH